MKKLCLAPVFFDLARRAYEDLDEVWIKDHERYVPPDYFLKDFRTVKISHHRNAGHTTAAAMLLHHYPRSLVICPNRGLVAHHFRDLYRRMYDTVVPDERLVVSIFSFGGGGPPHIVETQKNKGQPPFDFVIFDACSDSAEYYKDYAMALLHDYAKIFVWFQ